VTRPMSTTQMRGWIDKASYETLLEKWRFHPAGDALFQGEIGEYFRAKMEEKRAAVGHDGHVSASKHIGWER